MTQVHRAKAAMEASLALQARLAMASQFAAAETREAAAAALRGWHVGCELPHLLAAIRQAGTPLPVVKMEMLMGTTEDARQLRADTARSDGRVLSTWRPSRRNVYRFLKGCWQEVALEQAVALFARSVTEEYLRFQYTNGFSITRR